MQRFIFPAVAALVIVTGLAACDNVAWGGIDAHLQPPPERAALPSDAADEDASEAAEEVLEPLDVGPLVYLVETDAAGATLLPVGEVTSGGLRPLEPDDDPDRWARRFAAHRYAEGEEFVLLHSGRRAGTLVTRGEATPDFTYCPARPRGTAILELVPEAREQTRFLAVRKGDDPGLRHGPLLPESLDDDIRTASIGVAQSLIPRLGIPWPPSVLGIRRHVQVIPVPGSDEPFLSATFVHDDELTVGTPDQNAYSIFFLARPGDTEYEAVHVWYQRVDGEGKAWPRPIDLFPSAGGDRDALLLEVFGAEHRWFLALEPDHAAPLEGEWEVTFQDPCAEAGPES